MISALTKATKSQTEMRDVATKICREYLSGAWKTISSEEIQVKRISGGLSNFLYYVSLPKIETSCGSNSTKRARKESYHNMTNLDKVPCSVLLRIYGQTHGEHALETMLTESIVFALLSERQLGPKLHGIFPGGRIEQYIPARSLTTAELAQNQISLQIAEKMSEIHSLNIPVSKEPEWLFLTLNRWLNSVDTIFNDIKNNNDAMESNPLSGKLRKIDFRGEVNWLRNVIETAAYPVVFCHNDLQEGNILLRQRDFTPMDKPAEADLDNKALSPLNVTIGGQPRKRSVVDNGESSELDEMRNEKPELMIIDFEYCAYNYRAFDIANHFLEWTYDYSNDKFPFFHHLKENYPTPKQVDDFITVYLKKSTGERTPTQQEKRQLCEEVALFTLASHLFWGIWGVINVNQEIEFGYLDYSNVRLEEYFKAKEEFVKQRPHIVNH